MRVVIVGLPYFTEKLHKDLKAFDSQNTYHRLNTYYSKKDRLKALWLIPRADVIYSINGTIAKSRVFDLAFKRKKKVMMTWVGTDVTKAKITASPNQVYLNQAHHYCEVHWIQEELKSVKIDAQILNFFNFPSTHEAVMPPPGPLKVLSYISNGREEYYGWNQLIASAKACPTIQFTVVGTEGIGEWPENVKCLGWVNNMPELFEKHHTTIRFVEHDGLSGFVLESLSRGKHVLYSEPLNHCLHVQDVDEMVANLKKLAEQSESGSLQGNLEGVNFVRENFQRDQILSSLIQEMKA